MTRKLSIKKLFTKKFIIEGKYIRFVFRHRWVKENWMLKASRGYRFKLGIWTKISKITEGGKLRKTFLFGVDLIVFHFWFEIFLGQLNINKNDKRRNDN